MTYRSLVLVGAVSAQVLVGCGSSDDEGPITGSVSSGGSGASSGFGGFGATPGSGGASGSAGAAGLGGASGSAGQAGASGAAGAANACSVQAGKWRVVYSGGGGAPPEADVLVIDAKGSATFERAAPPDGCKPGGGLGSVTENQASLGAKCSLSGKWAANYCYSGETQFVTRELSLLFATGADTASGSMTLTSWTSPGTNKFPNTYAADATRLP